MYANLQINLPYRSSNTITLLLITIIFLTTIIIVIKLVKTNNEPL